MELLGNLSTEEAYGSVKDALSEIKNMGVGDPIISPEVSLKVSLFFSVILNYCYALQILPRYVSWNNGLTIQLHL